MNLDPTVLAERWFWFVGGAAGLAFAKELWNAVQAYQLRKALAGIHDELREIRKTLRRKKT